MRSSYVQTLPKVFPYYVKLTRDQALTAAVFLLSHGSSFAMTQDSPVTLWLSEASYRYLTGLEAWDVPLET